MTVQSYASLLRIRLRFTKVGFLMSYAQYAGVMPSTLSLTANTTALIPCENLLYETISLEY